MKAEIHERSAALCSRTLRAARATFVEEESVAYTIDPVFAGLRRNRVNAELLKAALRLPSKTAEELGYGAPFREKIARHLLASQKQDGCWHEIHPKYDEPSALATAFMAEALLAYHHAQSATPLSKEIEHALGAARDYVLGCERRSGFFLKSQKYTADHLNVDVSVGAFLAKYAAWRHDGAARDAAQRAVELVAREQFPDGAYPYTTADPGPPYPHPIHVPCIHYQGVTGYYLAKIHDALPSAAGENSLRRAATWLASVQRDDGTFRWAHSHMIFASYLTGAYAFGAALFSYAARWEPRHEQNAARALHALDPHVPGLAWRWESGRARDLPRDVVTATRAGWHGPFPASHKLMRVGHAAYRQLGRRSRSERAEERLFHLLRRTFRLTASTVEPSKNFPDLFITAEIADCAAAIPAFTSGGTSS